MPLLEITDLNVRFDTVHGEVTAVSDLSLTLEHGQTLGIVGESGSGKTQSMMSVLGLLAENAKAWGSVRFEGDELLGRSDDRLNEIRGKRIAMVFQDPMASLNPYITIGVQLAEALTAHEDLPRNVVRSRCLETLDAVRLPDARARLDMYPHELSGGMCQRVMIAIALICRPDLLIADEPTSALDVTIQAEILALLAELKEVFDLSIILISHDLGVVAELSDHVLVMYGGQAMEYGTLEDIYLRAQHPYTLGLLASLPQPGAGRDEPLQAIPGDPPDLLQLPFGCPFLERCAHRHEHCEIVRPGMRWLEREHLKACHLEGAP